MFLLVVLALVVQETWVVQTLALLTKTATLSVGDMAAAVAMLAAVAVLHLITVAQVVDHHHAYTAVGPSAVVEAAMVLLAMVQTVGGTMVLVETGQEVRLVRQVVSTSNTMQVRT
jgi:hypothetical protein